MNKKSKNILVPVILSVILVLMVGVFTFKFYSKYKQSNTFDFDQVSPEGYFTDLETSNPE